MVRPVWGSHRLSHLALLANQEPVAMVQLRIVRPGRLPCGIAYVRAGPLVQRKGEGFDPEPAHRIVEAMHDEFVTRGGLHVRVLPHALPGTARCAALKEAFLQFQFVQEMSELRRTLLLDLAPPLEELRRNLDQKWRNSLNRSEKNGLTIREGTGPEEFEAFNALYEQMIGRKRFRTDTNMAEFARLQGRLPEPHKMRIMICLQAGVPVAGLIGSAMGDMGIYLHGATGDKGLQAKGGYLLQWAMIRWLKENGFRYYDLGGINPKNNPGVYHFKKGLSGEDVTFVGSFSSCRNPLSRLGARLVFSAKNFRLGQYWRPAIRPIPVAPETKS